jgi:8-oxo-dGTP pyrophosphatase MutT (NUDIX family)
MSSDPRRTLVLPIKDGKVLLGMKQKHHQKAFGVGKWNGFGGKIEPGETIEEAAVRECHEECGAKPTKMAKVAVNHFPDYGQDVHVFLATEWTGDPVDTEEMHPEWFDKSKIPFEQMWEDDVFWLPPVLQSKKLIGNFAFRSDDDENGSGSNPLEKVDIKIVEGFDDAA